MTEPQDVVAEQILTIALPLAGQGLDLALAANGWPLPVPHGVVVVAVATRAQAHRQALSHLEIALGQGKLSVKQEIVDCTLAPTPSA